MYWPAPPTIHRGLEWPQFLNSLIVCLFVLCLFSDCLSANFLIYDSFISISKIFAVMNKKYTFPE